MKKFLLTLMLCLMTMAVQSQIQRKFFGLELGKSTYQEVKDYIKIKKWFILKKKNDFMYVTPHEPKYVIIFGGVKWNEMVFNFKNGILSLITFTYDEFVGSPIWGENEKSASLLEFNDLRRRIKDKYHSYLVIENSRKTAGITQDELFYQDGKTSLQIISSDDKLELTYKDDTKSAEKIEKENDEL